MWQWPRGKRSPEKILRYLHQNFIVLLETGAHRSFQKSCTLQVESKLTRCLSKLIAYLATWLLLNKSTSELRIIVCTYVCLMFQVQTPIIIVSHSLISWNPFRITLYLSVLVQYQSGRYANLWRRWLVTSIAQECINQIVRKRSRSRSPKWLTALVNMYLCAISIETTFGDAQTDMRF